MAVKLRLARWGAKKKPYYHVVASDSRAKRDGRYIEEVGKYNPMIDGDDKYNLKIERVQYWLGQGATPTDRVHKILVKLGLLKAKDYSLQNKKNQPKAKAQARLKEQQEAQEAAKESAQEETAEA